MFVWPRERNHLRSHPARPMALASMATAVVGDCLGLVAVGLLTVFYGRLEEMPNLLIPMIIGAMVICGVSGIVAIVCAARSFATAKRYGLDPHPLSRQGLGLGTGSVVLAALTAFVGIGASLNTIGP